MTGDNTIGTPEKLCAADIIGAGKMLEAIEKLHKYLCGNYPVLCRKLKDGTLEEIVLPPNADREMRTSVHSAAFDACTRMKKELVKDIADQS